MPGRKDIRQRVQSKVERGHFLSSLLVMAKGGSASVQQDFIDALSDTASGMREILDQAHLIQRIEYEPRAFWLSQRGKAYCFIDGGVANLDLPSAAPIGLRVGTYVVRPGDTSENRESFNIVLSLVDELYGDDAWVYVDITNDTEKLRDAARIISEAAAAWKSIDATEGLDAIFLHGPLVNPVSPYGFQKFPSFSQEAYNAFLMTEERDLDEEARHFVAAYKEILTSIRDQDVPVFGVVERSRGVNPVVIKEHLKRLQEADQLTPRMIKTIVAHLEDYRLNDAAVFDVVLQPGEYVTPVPINRQGPESKWPNEWIPYIRDYPLPFTSYLKPSEDAEPFRVETFETFEDLDQNLGLIFHTARLLPNYGFPVGLDIVDKFAKVPSWMNRSIRGQHATVLLKQALESNDPLVLAYAKKVLAARGRDWLFRPKV